VEEPRHRSRARPSTKACVIRAEDIEPTVTWGTSPEDTVAIGGVVPAPESFADASKQQAASVSLDYMGLEPGTRMTDIDRERVHRQCTNSRIEDIRAAAEVLKGRTEGANVKWAIVVPGSGLVKAQAEAEGLDRIITEAGPRMARAGLFGLPRDEPGQGAAGRTLRLHQQPQLHRPAGSGQPHPPRELPAMAAAAAVTGKLTDVRELVG
jgi:3-isopropylmalate/(R)-2-methylmalate dehydratase large subunit